MPLFRSKKKSAQAATLKVQSTAVMSTHSDAIVQAGQGRTAAGAERSFNDGYVSVPSATNISSNPFYQTVNAGRHEIRVLEVFSGAYPQPIKCVLRPICLLAPSAPQYETVSYCWGQPRRGFPINLNGHKRYIENSAGSVLHRLRLPDRNRTVWIDAVCINQDDEIEKGQQVSIMGDIYRCSKLNVVYFGQVDEFAPAVQSTFLTVLADMKRKIPKDTTLYDLTHGNTRPGQTNMSKMGNLMDKKINLKPLDALYSSPWFGRIWVVQEVALAPTSVCYFGSAEFLLADVLQVAVWLIWHKNMLWPHSVISAEGLARASSIWYMADHDAILKGSYQLATRDLASVCKRLEAHDASNPKDKIYALLGLHGRWKPRGWQAIVPRYEKTVSVSEVYQDATRFMIQESNSLEILQYRCPRAEKPLMPNTPSWVVDFTRLGGKGIRPRHLGFGFAAHDGRAIKECTYLAPQDPRVLPLMGFILDSVKARTRTIADREGPYVPELADILRLSQDLGLSYRDVSERLARTLIANRDSNGAVPGSRTQDEYSAFLSLCNDEMKLLLKHAEAKPSRTHKELVYQGGRYFTAFQLACIGRCFFLTKGGLMGIGPATLADGDSITVLYGGKVPFAVSAAGTGRRGRYRMLGECYVDGVMQGEGMRKHKASGNRDEMFNMV